ncbi:MAG TPA: hypothetical protein VLE27_01570 [Thermoanaerobaculia bacterium]|nr:hypothetical protein [Thermoanaerobaculia bacterium]
MCCLLLYGLYGAVAASAQDEPLQAWRHGEALALVPGTDGARLELPGGRSLRLSLPERAEVSSFAALDGGWVVAGSFPEDGGRRRLFLLRGNEKRSWSLAVPPAQEGRRRSEPALLVDNGRLAGLAWLEGDGDRDHSVRSAAWKGQGWATPERVSYPGPGTQIALTGAVLSDGSWLLAWSAFDGQDDEIVWSLRAAGAWLPVRRLSPGNAVPDITPAVTATAGNGALIAWSRYDGRGYQLRTARFERGEWTSEKTAGPSGSLYPTFLGEAGKPRLLYMDAWPRAWSVLDLDAEGRVLAKATVPSEQDRPVVTFQGDGEVRMRWLSRKGEVKAAWEKVR